MQKLASYDPYTIKEIQFFVQKKTKYSTIKSLIVSLFIFGLTIVVNYKSLKDIWAQRSQLRIQSSNQRTTSEELTSSYLCMISKSLLQDVPGSTLGLLDRTANLTTFPFSITNQFDGTAEILTVAGGRKFKCYDIQGAIINTRISLLLSVTGQVDYIFKTYSLNQIMGKQIPNYYSLVPQVGTKSLFQFQIKKIKAIMYDNLLVSYEPQTILSISNQLTMTINQIAVNMIASNMTQIRFSSQEKKVNQLTQIITFNRKNIGQILGNFFSWLTIFILIFTFLIAPIVNFNFKLDLSKKIYDNKTLAKINFSVLMFVRYIISTLKKGIFEEEDTLNEIFQILQHDLDILEFLKKQNTMSTLIAEHRQIEVKLEEPEQKYEKDELTQREIELFVDKDLLSLDSQHVEGVALRNQKEEKVFEVTQDKKYSRSNFITEIIKVFDIGQTVISLLANKGRGYRTSWSTILTALFIVLLLVFLIFAGFFTLQTNYQTKTVLQSRFLSQQQTKVIQINPKDMIFRALYTNPTDNFVFQVAIINQRTEIIQNVTLLSGSACNNYVAELNQVVGSGWLCLSKPINLINDGKFTKQMLGFRLTFPVFGFTDAEIQITYKQTILIQNKLASRINRIKKDFASTSILIYEIQILSKEKDSKTQLFWTSYKQYFSDQSLFKGLAFQLLSQYQQVSENQTTLWDVIDTSWGIFILTFSILLAKISSYLNVKQRSKITVDQQNQLRNDICSIISTQHELQQRVFPDQLKSIKYYYKKQYLVDLNNQK